MEPMSKIRLSFLLLFSAIAQPALGAACCGGGVSVPSLITGDERAQLNASYGYSRVTDDVGSDSYWRRRESRESSETLKINGSHIFNDRWQSGVSLPLVRRIRNGHQSSGLGDVAGMLGYEYLPDWDYNPWRPRGHGFFQITAPTGRSVQEADSDYQLDARGRGFWALGVGTVLSKSWGRWDLFTDFDLHRSFSKRFSNAQTSGRLNPGYGGNFGVSGGYNYSQMRFGGGLSWFYEDPIDVTGTINSNGSPQRYTSAMLSVSYLLPQEWTATLNYSDQTWFGSPSNTSLTWAATLVLQKRWLR